ncbi:MAG: hypothetical protein DWQ34_03895 [Planctomycetota bacterium]|nr:MAG: hypothetical protein DWQ34_03895 [Planctomycetota bacterium]REK29659.1 MAG: hypothetical protein DWQ41_03200 [Planctomycetota bacterium]REK30521.1 MAG: hypothetical protein DWQ45_21835 [Planctomycetota bacterium]
MAGVARYRILILPVSAVVIALLVAWRLGRETDRQDAVSQPPPVRRQLAPVFELYDQNNQLVKFERYLGRTRLVVVFYEAATGADEDPHLVRLRRHIEDVAAAGVQVVGISTAVPAENRRAAERAGGEFPFPLLTDIDPVHQSTGAVHGQWGLSDPETGALQTGLFLVDRAGMVGTDDGTPVPEESPESVVDALCSGRWPR